MQNGINGDYYYIHQAAGEVSELTNGLIAAGFEAISESIRAYTVCVLPAQLFARITMVGNTSATLDAQAEFVNALKTVKNKSVDLSADIGRYQNILSNVSSFLNFVV